MLKALPTDASKLFAKQLESRNLEGALSRLRSIASLLSANQSLDDLTKDAARELDQSVCNAISTELHTDRADLGPMLRFAAWAVRSQYHWPLELFSVNYDLLVETALESLRGVYFDGFVGAVRASFNTEMVEASPGDPLWLPSRLVRLWKLHGSVNWTWDGPEVVRVGRHVEDRPAAIYPAETKYEESRRLPFAVLHDRFRRALQQPETLFLVTGYSFSDQHLNEAFFDAATRYQRSEIVALCFGDKISDLLAERSLATPNLQAVAGKEAILGGIRGDWDPPQGPPPDIWDDGRYGLVNFRHLASYLGRSSVVDLPVTDVLRSFIEASEGAEPQDG